jgi:hypothetical protein
MDCEEIMKKLRRLFDGADPAPQTYPLLDTLCSMLGGVRGEDALKVYRLNPSLFERVPGLRGFDPDVAERFVDVDEPRVTKADFYRDRLTSDNRGDATHQLTQQEYQDWARRELRRHYGL